MTPMAGCGVVSRACMGDLSIWWTPAACCGDIVLAFGEIVDAGGDGAGQNS
jgi:hypothetical protein